MLLGDEVTWRAPHFVAFASPLAPLGWVVDRVVLRRFMVRLLLEHNAAVARAASTP